MRRMSRTQETFEQLRQALADLLPIPAHEIAESHRLDELIPVEDRRRIWQKLRDAGFALPELTLSHRVFVGLATAVVAPITALAFLLQWWPMLFSTIELGIVARKLMRVWAVHPPYVCETIKDAVMWLTRFTPEDYRAGLWTREEIALKVRLVLAEASNRPVSSITPETRLIDLFT